MGACTRTFLLRPVLTEASALPLTRTSLRSALLSDEERAAGLMPAGRPEA